jgi:hypothetical protein
MNEGISCLFCCFSLRARIETRSSICCESLQCSERIRETVANPYYFDDYLRAMSERKGIKEGCGGSRWQTQQPQSTPTFFLPQQNPFKYAVQESDFLKVHHISLSLSLCHFPFWQLF